MPDPTDTSSDDLAELIDAVEDLEADEDVDLDARTRQDEGWLRFYLECPDCQVPLNRTSSTSETSDVEDARRATHIELQAVCPSCHQIVGRVEIEKTLFETDDPV